jgi:transcriptional pleiotropic regulator of transition state genes
MRVGTPRRIDQLGRIVIPAELRHALGLSDGDPVDIRIENGAVVVTKVEPARVVCSSTERLSRVRDKSLCEECVCVIRGDGRQRLKGDRISDISAA